MNENNFKRFSEVYAKHLTAAVIKYPEKYLWPAANAPVVAQKMMDAVRRGTASIDGPAWKWTCKELGIKHTKKAINEFLNAAELPLWVQEFGPAFDVPKIITDALEDVSYHNDMCPSFIQRESADSFSLWCDHPDVTKREVSSGKRFWVFNSDTDITTIETDDAAEALKHFLSLTATK